MSAGIQALGDCDDSAVVGGKAANLAKLIRAGFAVPDGFVVTDGGTPADEIIEAWRALGAPTVAVRSSATGEDRSDASMAGQHESVLGVTNEAALLDAVARCRASLDSTRAQAYRAARGDAVSRMAVIVQRFVPAVTAGVLFTSDPRNAAAMRVEAVRGTGEKLVGGQAHPESWEVNAETGETMPSSDAACLTPDDLHRLWQLGCEVADCFGCPQDIEWALCGGELFILQARAITTTDAAIAQSRRQEDLKTALRRELAAGRGPWALHNMSETLPAPTPLTWSVVGRFLSSDGGFGELYRRVGLRPSDGADIARLIAGRIYMDLAGAPELLGLPLRYDVELLRRDPAAAQGLPTVPIGSLISRLRTKQRIEAVGRCLRKLGEDLDGRLTSESIPAFRAWCREEKKRDLRELTTDRWVALWRERERQVFDEFAPDILLATLVSGTALADLRAFLAEHFWDEGPDALAQLLAAEKSVPAHTADLWRLAQSECSIEEWLADHGHRGPDEMELAAARWREQPERLREMAGALGNDRSPLEACRQRHAAAERKHEELTAQLSTTDAQTLSRLIDLCRRYMAFRETGRHWLMLGCDLLRDLALEAGRRLDGSRGVFMLSLDELAEALRAGAAPLPVIAAREKERTLDRGIWLPSVLDAAAVERLGELPEAPASGTHQGLGVSAGTATGRVRIISSAAQNPKINKGDILVCPALDPNLTPLFLEASALVVESGGTLSHAAIVAREMNLPTVVLPGATALLAAGIQVAVDGSAGTVSLLDRAATAGDDLRLSPREIPPPPGRRERLAGRARNVGFVFWSVFLLAVFALPEGWLHRPALAALDTVLWSAVPALGPAAAVAVIAALLAVLVALVQRSMTDNPRLREAKKRAEELSRRASAVPDGPGRRKMLDMAAAVQARLLGASCVSPALLLGPLVMILLWIPQRVEPGRANPPAGADFSVIASVDSAFRGPVSLSVGPGLAIDDTTPAAQQQSPIRDTLEKLLAERRAPADSPERAAELAAYLRRGVPPQKLLWKVRQSAPATGRFPVTVVAGSGSAAMEAVFGEALPPAERIATGTGAVQSVEVVIAGIPSAEPFWQPFRFARWGWDAGWLGVYLAGYLTTALLCRRLFRLP